MLSEALLRSAEGEQPADDATLPPGTGSHVDGFDGAFPHAAVQAHETVTALLSEQETALELRLAERETEIVTLTRQLGAAGRQDQERRRTEERLVTKLADRTAQLKRLLEKLRRERLEMDELRSMLEVQQQRREALESELERVRLQLFHWRLLAREAQSTAAEDVGDRGQTRFGGTRPEIRRPASQLVFEYVANLVDWWQDMCTRIAVCRKRVMDLVLSALQKDAESDPAERSDRR